MVKKQELIDDLSEFLSRERVSSILNYLISQSVLPEKEQETRFKDIKRHLEEEELRKGIQSKRKKGIKLHPKILTELLGRLFEEEFIIKKKLPNSELERYVINPKIMGTLPPFIVRSADRHLLTWYKQSEIVHNRDAHIYGLNPDIFDPLMPGHLRTPALTKEHSQMYSSGINASDLFDLVKKENATVILPREFFRSLPREKLILFHKKVQEAFDAVDFPKEKVKTIYEPYTGVIPAIKNIVKRILQIKKEYRKGELSKLFDKKVKKMYNVDESIYDFLIEYKDWYLFVLNDTDWDLEFLMKVLNRPALGFRPRKEDDVATPGKSILIYSNDEGERDVPHSLYAALKEMPLEKKEKIAKFFLDLVWSCKTYPTKVTVVAHSSPGLIVDDVSGGLLQKVQEIHQAEDKRKIREAQRKNKRIKR